MTPQEHAAKHQEIQNLLDAGEFEKGGNLAAQLLRANMSDLNARTHLKRASREHGCANVAEIRRFLFDQYASMEPILSRAARGWQYAAHFDREFVTDLSQLPAPAGEKQQMDEQLEPLIEADPGELLRSILAEGQTKGRWSRLREIASEPHTALLQDSYAGCEQTALTSTIFADIDAAELKIIVLGAGPAGLVMANSLKVAFGNRAEIIVLENRVAGPHRQKPYTRDWLTFIPRIGWEALLDPRIPQAVEKLAIDNYLGLPLHLFETLLMLSCKDLGVRFLFDKSYDLEFAAKTDIAVVFDSSGGRIRYPRMTQEPLFDRGRSFNFKTRESAGEIGGYSSFGITNTEAFPAFDFSGRPSEGWLEVQQAGQDLAVPMLKIVGLPADLQETILELVRAENADSKFYIWPGTLKPEINELLLLVNLDAKTYAYLAENLSIGQPLGAVLGSAGSVLERYDPRLHRMLLHISDGIEGEGKAIVEPPFVYRPKIRPFSTEYPSVHGAPVFPIGDSLFNGHPKVGNGLGAHIAHIQAIHDNMMLARFKTH